MPLNESSEENEEEHFSSDEPSAIQHIESLIESLKNGDASLSDEVTKSALKSLLVECERHNLIRLPRYSRLELLSFPINIEAVLKHLNQDMRDDWYIDVIQHRDLFANKTDLQETIKSLLLENNGGYLGSERAAYDIPKKGLGVRYSLETDFYDRFIYQAICSYLIPFFDPLLSHRVLGHRYNKHRKSERYIFKSRIDLWQTFEGVTKTALPNNQTLLITDLINYFENISIAIIKESFESMLTDVDASGPEKSQIRNAVQTLCELLTRWGYNERHGLPQNRDSSSFIANVVLNSIDQAMVKQGYDYYRYVDDIRIICNSTQEAKKALIILVGQLRTIGMNINSGKTLILNSESSEQEICENFPTTDDRTLTIDNMWRSRSRRVIARSAKYIYQLVKDCIDQKQTQSRQFRFSVNRLIQLTETGLFDIHASVAEELKQLLIGSLEDHAASTDQYCRILGILELNELELEKICDHLCDDDKSIHSWQSFHLWLLLAKKGYKTDKLIQLSCSKINNNLLAPEASAIFIYLRCIGETQHLEALIPEFRSTWPYYHKRNFLLATSELKPETLKPLLPQLCTKTQGTAARAKSHYENGVPLTNRETRSVLDLYEEISPYD